MLRPACVVAVVCLAALAGCPPTGAPSPIPPGPVPGSGYQSGAPIGAACDTGGDCAAGLCVGPGCGPGGGHCADPGLLCTADVVDYCGCDGATFSGSSGCPGARYATTGACPAVTPPALLADGIACLDSAACASGTCEGQGCGPDAPGVCMSGQRACTMDLRPYCGCDGETFKGSGTCPGRRYQAKGVCAAASLKADGAACLDGAECTSGTCEGLGCGPDAPGTCAPQQRGCTRDLRSYCGCDGRTFKGSGSCPGRRYAAAGAC